MLALAAAIENASEHPLAGAVLECAEAALLGPSSPASHAAQPQGLQEEPWGSGAPEPSEAAPLVGLPSPTAQAGGQHRRTDWLRVARDAEPAPGAPPPSALQLPRLCAGAPLRPSMLVTFSVP